MLSLCFRLTSMVLFTWIVSACASPAPLPTATVTAHSEKIARAVRNTIAFESEFQRLD